ncbi:MAG: isoamylase early set domain-containing protein [Kiritimatiellae bacterium]|nr:isoamylase early set domain-containing protein [Kiritimatiellia bacterium]
MNAFEADERELFGEEPPDWARIRRRLEMRIAAPRGFTAKVMARLDEPAAAEEAGARRVLPFTPNARRLALAGLAAAAAVLVLVRAFRPGPAVRPVEEAAPSVADVTPAAAPAPAPAASIGRAALDTPRAVPIPAEPTRVVTLTLRLPQAGRVAVAGDFNGWAPADLQRDAEKGDDLWTITLRLQAGRYQYGFIVDGATWLADPGAKAYAEDGFGGRNAILKI